MNGFWSCILCWIDEKGSRREASGVTWSLVCPIYPIFVHHANYHFYNIGLSILDLMDSARLLLTFSKRCIDFIIIKQLFPAHFYPQHVFM